MNRIYRALLIILFFCSCTQDKKMGIERISDISYTVLTDSIYTRMPGELFYCDKHIVWIDPFSSEDFVHVLDVSSGKERGCFGKVGNGPHEFTDALFSSMTYDSLLVLYDLGRNLQGYAELNKVGMDTASAFVKWRQEELGPVTRYLEIGERRTLLLYPNAASPFVYKYNDKVDSIGNFPISEKITNGYSEYQGEMLYNPIRKSLIYLTYNFSYAAMYKLDNDKWTLAWEKREKTDYRIVNNELKQENRRLFFHEATLSKDYIVLTKRDEEKEGRISEKEEDKMDMIKRLPYSLFLYDYDFNLKKIITLDAPVIRLAGDIHSNTLYAIIVNPEYSIIKLELPM